MQNLLATEAQLFDPDTPNDVTELANRDFRARHWPRGLFRAAGRA